MYQLRADSSSVVPVPAGAHCPPRLRPSSRTRGIARHHAALVVLARRWWNHGGYLWEVQDFYSLLVLPVLKLFYGCSCWFSMSLFKQMDCSLRQMWISRLVCHTCNTGRHHNVFIYLNVPFFQVCIKRKLTNVVWKMFKVWWQNPNLLRFLTR